MAVMVGRTKNWLWWLGGLVCALIFGQASEAGEVIFVGKKTKYGAPARPVVAEDQKKQARELIAEYLKPVEAVEPGAEARKEIEALIKDFGSEEFARREAASKAIVRHGAAALGALREAAKSADAEISQRARLALGVIGNAGRGEALAGLRKMGRAGWTAVGQERAEAYRAQLAASKALAEAKESGDAAKLAKAEADRRAALERQQKLGRLYATLRPQPVGKAYGVRVPAW